NGRFRAPVGAFAVPAVVSFDPCEIPSPRPSPQRGEGVAGPSRTAEAARPMTSREKAQVLDDAGLDRALRRIAHEIIEQAEGVENVALVGIKTRGVTL